MVEVMVLLFRRVRCGMLHRRRWEVTQLYLMGHEFEVVNRCKHCDEVWNIYD